MNDKTGKTFELTDSATGRAAHLPVRAGTIGPAGLDISHLQPELDVFSYDPGFGMTAATESRITYIDGDAGVLLYRGYPIEQLAEIIGNIRYHTMINESLLEFFDGFHYNAHPMAMVSGVVASMAAFYHDTM